MLRGRGLRLRIVGRVGDANDGFGLPSPALCPDGPGGSWNLEEVAAGAERPGRVSRGAAGVPRPSDAARRRG